MTPIEKRNVIGELAEQLGEQEILVLLTLGRRLLAGQQNYGFLQLEIDRRDWRKERALELADACIYDAFHEIAHALREP